MQTPNQQLLKTDLLIVTAHPDDESMLAGTMARCADQGKVVSLVVCTRGEGGGNGTGKELGAALGVVREAELRRCAAILGVKYLYFLDQADWAYTESVRATLAKWGREPALGRLVRLVRQLRPDVIATMDPTPVGGQHGHHQAAGRFATEAFARAADPKRYPEQLRDEGLETWAAKKLYWVSFSGGTLQLPVAPRYAEVAARAEASHRSQGFDKFAGSAAFFGRPNAATLVRSRVAPPTPEADLFDGCDAAAGALRGTPTPGRGRVDVALQPLPAWRDYNAWLVGNGLGERVRTDPPVAALAAGRPSSLVVEIVNDAAVAQTVDVGVALPAGWRAPARRTITVPAGKTVAAPFLVTPPPAAAHAAALVRLDARVRGGRDAWSRAVHIPVLPATTARRLTSPLPLAADPEPWRRRGIAPVAVPHTFAAQGKVRDDAEHSGRFFVAYDAAALHALVEVIDDTVVFNIAPDDIKGHWRSTSVELCVDPHPRAEDTFGTLKLGVFPQDTTGRVRACRDADANPGPIDRVEPGIALASRRTPTGYVVASRVPWAALKTRPTSGAALGWNVVLYHAGKAQARVGEDVGKSRLAWSYGPGVWGRPEIWGTLVLE